MIDFFVECIPPKTTAQQKRHNRTTGQFYHSETQLAAISAYGLILAPNKPPKPISGATSLTIELTWPWIAKTPKKITQTRDRIRMTARPDCSNICKEIEDQLVVWRFIENDQSVAELIVRKWWGSRPGVRIRIEELL